jgi:hypothetical protein
LINHKQSIKDVVEMPVDPKIWSAIVQVITDSFKKEVSNG